MSVTQPVLEVTDLGVTIESTVALTGVTTAVRAGEAVALLGANGSGKSTMVRAILGLTPSQGRIELFGLPQARFREWGRIGYVPQHSSPSLLGATVREVVSSGRLGRQRPFSLPNRTERQLVAEAIERVGLAGREGWELSQLSGGQQQRARIARALVSAPEFLVLDEPLAGLDLASQRSLATLLAGLKDQGMALLVVLHEVGPLAPLLDRALVLEHGHLVRDGVPRPTDHDHDCHSHDEPTPHGEPRLLDGVAIGDCR